MNDSKLVFQARRLPQGFGEYMVAFWWICYRLVLGFGLSILLFSSLFDFAIPEIEKNTWVYTWVFAWTNNLFLDDWVQIGIVPFLVMLFWMRPRITVSDSGLIVRNWIGMAKKIPWTSVKGCVPESRWITFLVSGIPSSSALGLANGRRLKWDGGSGVFTPRYPEVFDPWIAQRIQQVGSPKHNITVAILSTVGVHVATLFLLLGMLALIYIPSSKVPREVYAYCLDSTYSYCKSLRAKSGYYVSVINDLISEGEYGRLLTVEKDKVLLSQIDPLDVSFFSSERPEVLRFVQALLANSKVVTDETRIELAKKFLSMRSGIDEVWVSLLLGPSLKVDAKRSELLEIAFEYNHEKEALFLIGRGEGSALQKWKYAELFISAGSHNQKLAEWALSKYGKIVSNDLLLAAIAHGNLDQVKVLLEKGVGKLPVSSERLAAASGNSAGAPCRSIINCAFPLGKKYKKFSKTQEYLYKQGLLGQKLNSALINPQQLLSKALHSGDLQQAELAIKYGAILEGNLSPYRAVMNEDMALWLFDRGLQPKVDEKSGVTLLHIAARKGWFRVADRLILSGIDVNVRTTDGSTPLNMTTNVRMAEYLMSKGADPNIPGVVDSFRATPLHHAVHSGNVAMIKALRSHGASLMARDIAGRTPRMMADIFYGGAGERYSWDNDYIEFIDDYSSDYASSNKLSPRRLINPWYWLAYCAMRWNAFQDKEGVIAALEA